MLGDSINEQINYLGADYKDGYLDALSDVLDMLGSVPENNSIYKLKESLRKTIEEGSK